MNMEKTQPSGASQEEIEWQYEVCDAKRSKILEQIKEKRNALSEEVDKDNQVRIRHEIDDLERTVSILDSELDAIGAALDLEIEKNSPQKQRIRHAPHLSVKDVERERGGVGRRLVQGEFSEDDLFVANQVLDEMMETRQIPRLIGDEYPRMAERIVHWTREDRLMPDSILLQKVLLALQEERGEDGDEEILEIDVESEAAK